MKYLPLILSLCLVSCSPKHDRQLMTIKTYQETNVGMSEENLLKTYGYPHNIIVLDSEVKQYEYIERFQTGNTPETIVEVRRYFFYIKDNKVVSKRMTIKNQPAWEVNSDNL